MSKDTILQQKLKKLSSYIAPVDDIPSTAATIEEKLIIEPNMPIGIFIQETFNICMFVQDDRELLVQRGLNWGVVEELPRRIEHLKNQESLWWKARFSPTPSQREFERVKALAEQVKNELLRDLEFLADSDNALHEALCNVKEGSGEDDLMVDLKSLSMLSQNKKDKLQLIGSDPELLEDVKYCSEVFPKLLVSFGLEQSAATSKQSDRNQAYTLLLVAVEEIRRCAAHVFWNDKKHLKGYQSEYFRKRSLL